VIRPFGGRRSERVLGLVSVDDVSRAREGKGKAMLKEYPKPIKLKDGTMVTARPLEKGDVDDLFGFFERVPKEDRLFLKEDVTDRSVIEEWTENLDYKRVLPIVAVESGTIVADATLHRRTSGWTSHVGKIRVVVDRAFREKGLASRLVQELINIAENAGLDKIVVEVMDTQDTAKKAFERLGFKEEAKLTNYVKDLAGKRHDIAIMVHDITPMWGY
jgi:ribosomal protein S18 acetylase RimI-like enzyme